MKLKKNVASAAMLLMSMLYSNLALAQENIATARPTSGIGAWTIPANSFQFEQGFTYVNDTLVLDGLFRLAVSKIGEIRVLTLYGSDHIVFGAKVMLLNPATNKTGLALKLSIDSDFRVLDFRMVATRKINDTFSVIGNVGVIPGGRWYGIALLNIGLGDKFGTYVEGFFRGSYQQYNTGLTFLINSETQLDFSTGLINNNSGYIGLGFARRLKFDHLIH
jgi:hypothetical protein